MPAVYDGLITVPAATASRLSTLMVAAGYTGNFIGAHLEVASQAVADLFHGPTSGVTSANGRALAAGATLLRQAQASRWCVDPSRIWLISATGGVIGVSFETF